MYLSIYLFIIILCILLLFFFFFNDTATTEIYTLSLHDALPTFTGWSGACTGTGSCNVNPDNGASVTATFGASLQSVNHIVFMVQENRGLDHYFGALQQYRTQKGIPGTFDGLPQFNSPGGATASNPGCDPAFPFQPSPAPFNDCITVVNGASDHNRPQAPSQP